MANESYAVGVNTKLWMEPGTTAKSDALTFDASSEAYDFLSEGLARHRTIIGTNSIRGTRMAHSINTRFARHEFYGEIHKYISPAELDTLLPKFLGAEATDVFRGGNGITGGVTEEEIPYFDVLVSRDAGIMASPSTSIYQYLGCKMDQFVLRGKAAQAGEEAEPSMVTAGMRIVACSETEVSYPAGYPYVPALGTGATYSPYVFTDCDSAVTIAGAARPIEEFVLVVNNFAVPKYVNSLNPYAIRTHGRVIQLRVMMPWNDTNDDVYDQALAGAAATIQLSLTGGTYSTKFEFGALQLVGEVTPTASRGKGQISLIMDFIARATGSTAAIYDMKVTNDLTA